MRRVCSIGPSALVIVQKIRVPAIVIMLCSMFVAYGQAGRKGEIAIAFGNVLIGLSLWIPSRRLGALALMASGAGVAGLLLFLNQNPSQSISSSHYQLGLTRASFL